MQQTNEPTTGPSASIDVTSGLIRTNVQAVVDPIAVKVGDGVRVRVGMRNAGPRTVSTPGRAAVMFQLYVVGSSQGVWVRSLGGCQFVPESPPQGNPPIIDVPVGFFACESGSTLRVGETFWQSFIFPNLDAFESDPRYGYGVRISGGGPLVDDLVPSDNHKDVKVRLGNASQGLPVTGGFPISVAAGGLGLILAGAVIIWTTRRRRLASGTHAWEPC